MQAILPRNALLDLVRGKIVAPDEALDLLMAAGWEPAAAWGHVKGIALDAGLSETTLADPHEGEFLPSAGPRGRRPVRYPKDGSKLRGHPLD